MMQIKIDGSISHVYTPYNAEFVAKIKGIGGAKWNGSLRCWDIPSFAVDSCREIMKSVYGETDRTEEDAKYVTLRLTFNEEFRSDYCGPVAIMGKTVARAYGRDSGAKAGEDVAFVSGRPTSGGSAKNWQSIVPKDSVVILNRIPENIYKDFDIRSVPGLHIEQVCKETTQKADLLAEKEKLIARLAEIEKLLEDENS